MRKMVIVAMLTFLVILSISLANGCTTFKRWSYEGVGRDDWQQPAQVMETLGIQPEQDIADLGAGGGYFTFRLAEATGSGGTVYAVDVDEGMVDYLDQRAKEEGYMNVETILGNYDDPLLPPEGVDLIFTCNTYHHLKTRVDYFNNIRKYLRDGGRIAIIDFAGKTWFQRLLGHTTPAEVIRAEMVTAGYRLTGEHEFLSKQNLLIFQNQ